MAGEAEELKARNVQKYREAMKVGKGVGYEIRLSLSLDSIF